jgi:flagellar L-ring protein precursor FlgH
MWTPRSVSLFRDIRAYQVCDILRVDIVERSSATNNAETRVDSEGGLTFGADALGQLRVRGPVGVDPERLLEMTNRLRSERAGGTTREGDVTFSISATVKKVLSNGNLFLEGETVVLVNSEENHFYVSGVARPEDVTADNAIRSSRLADAHIEFTGRGVIAESQEPGWLARIWNWIINPI